MSEEKIQELVRTMAKGELPMPPWSRVQIRATFEDEMAPRQAPILRLSWLEMAIYVGVSIAIAALATWAIVAFRAGFGA